jgi:hypothetical protein
MKRRKFLQPSVAAGLGFSGMARGLLGQTSAPAETSVARVYLDTRRTIAPLSANLFGSFLEHLGRAMKAFMTLVQNSLTQTDFGEM